MQRITTATRAPNLFGAGKDGFRNGDLSAGVDPTALNADWFNGTQEELLNVIEGAGLTPSNADLTQLLQALRILTGGAGRIQPFARDTAPTGWIECDGRAVSRSTYAALFAAIGTKWGAGDGSTTFNLPDARGEFLRGWDHGRGVDTGRAFASAQASQNLQHNHGVNETPHTHGASTNPAGNHTHNITSHRVNAGSIDANAGAVHSTDAGIPTGFGVSAPGDHTHGVNVNSASTGITTQNAGGSEARPRSIAVLYCISIF